MLLTKEIAIVKNTAEVNTQEAKIEAAAGTIHLVEIGFPPGCWKLAKVRIFRGIHQVWPEDRGTYFAADAWTISFRENYQLKEPPFFFTVRAWNEDTANNHTITVRLGLLPKAVELSSSLAALMTQLGEQEVPLPGKVG